MLDISGPWGVFGHANDVLGLVAYELELVGPNVPAITTRHGLTLGGIRPLPKSGARLPNVAVVAGGSPLTPLSKGETELVAWIRQQHRRIPTLVSICTGAFLLGEAGALDGHRVTTHWRFLEQLQSRFPKANVIDEGIFVHEKRLWTSAGITAGIDLALALVEQDHGHVVAMTVAKKLVLFLRRSGKQAQFSSTLQRQENAPSKLNDISTFVLEHLDQSLSVDRIAGQVGMSPRTLSRWCRAHLGESPADLVRRLRIEEARRLLEETQLPLKAITTRTGLGDESTLWRVFMQHLGVTPGEYRQRFSSAS